jgi:hypothetical protein
VFEQLAAVMAKYDCDSVTDAVGIASAVALKLYEARLTQILSDKLSD